MMKDDIPSLKTFFDEKVLRYNQPSFIKDDPVCIPHLFTKKQDIEIAAFFAAIFAWGNRTTIINKSKELMLLMDNAPHQFCIGHSSSDLKRLLKFKHRTFNTTDLLYFIEFLRYHYTKHESLETAFFDNPEIIKKTPKVSPNGGDLEGALNSFYQYFFSLPDVPARTKKHIASPEKNATCKRLNMFLRSMVRKDEKGVDFGLWKKISPAHLICPVDVHVARVARHFKLLNSTPLNWKAALQLTGNLRILDTEDPVKYDFALFGLGVLRQF